MLGLGETTEELLDTLADLLDAGCRMLTLGQYLQPSPAQMPVVRYLPAEEFAQLGESARRMGFDARGQPGRWCDRAITPGKWRSAAPLSPGEGKG